jgi:two-component system, LuxR family, response regulator FixJ
MRFVTQMVMAARTIRLPNPPLIAIVEDDEAIREALSVRVLELSSRTFDRADALLAAYAPRAFGCLITDIRMPGISGLELQQKLTSLGSTIPVIVVTSSNDPLTTSGSLKEGQLPIRATRSGTRSSSAISWPRSVEIIRLKGQAAIIRRRVPRHASATDWGADHAIACFNEGATDLNCYRARTGHCLRS